MKKLLITNFFPPQAGGIQNYYLNLLSRLEPAEICVLAQTQAGEKEFDQTQPYHIYRTDFFSGKIPPRWRPLIKEINDIVKTEGVERLAFGHFHPYNSLAGKIKLPFYVFAHGTDITQAKDSWWQKRLLKQVYGNPLCRKFIANSDYLAEEIFKLTKDKTKIEIIYPGIDYEALNKPDEDFAGKKKLLGLADNDVVMLSMCRLEPEKNIETVIKMLPELLSLVPELKYIIVGGGSQEEKLKNLAQQSGLKYNVIFAGEVANIPEAKAFYLQLAHIYITVSLKPEGFGIGYLEASATRTAVIASKFGGSKEAVLGGVTGILVDPRINEEIKSAIIKIATDRELWRRLAEAGQKRALEFDWSKQAEKIKNIINN
ncbi:MAG: glycosyltransferase family 4 protein [Patescibacteria group bacterium]|jgi:phosphatidylinositol alpha-1,6-mannosyltransferase